MTRPVTAPVDHLFPANERCGRPAAANRGENPIDLRSG